MNDMNNFEQANLQHQSSGRHACEPSLDTSSQKRSQSSLTHKVQKFNKQHRAFVRGIQHSIDESSKSPQHKISNSVHMQRAEKKDLELITYQSDDTLDIANESFEVVQQDPVTEFTELNESSNDQIKDLE